MQADMSDRKMGILTMHRVKNSGSFLQAYATQMAIERLGLRCEIIDYLYPTKDNGRALYHTPMTYRFAWQHLAQNVYHRRWDEVRRQLREMRWSRMIQKMLKVSDQSYDTQEELMAMDTEYDTILLGSDQVWNERFTKEDMSFMLPFAKDDVRCVSYASSAPSTNMTDAYRQNLKRHLAKFESIATREKESARLLTELLGRKVDVVLDPVMLFGADEWTRKLRIKPKGQKKYVLVYLLNYMGNATNAAMTYTDNYTHKHPESDIFSTIQMDKPYVKLTDVMPKEFVELIANADYVITDSFHASAFALLYRVPLVPMIYEKATDTRLIDLCNRVGVKKDDAYMCEEEKLQKEREESWNYLKRVLER